MKTTVNKKSGFLILSFLLFYSFSGLCITANYFRAGGADTSIIFYSNDSVFAPVIVLEGEATVCWTWDDNTTSTLTNPVKHYGTQALRENHLVVTPWSALRRINIGYDALDGGAWDKEFVTDQKVSDVRNLHLVAPYLREWCSSYGIMDSLDFGNFVNLELIECYHAWYLEWVNLTNTPKLRRACFEDNSLTSFDISDCVSLEDIRGAYNLLPTIAFSNSTDEFWHICIHHNPFVDSTMFKDMTGYPNIAELYIWDLNQKDTIIIPSTNATREIGLYCYNNNYTFVNLEGALQNTNYAGFVNFMNNKLDSININGCIQISSLELNDNNLDSLAVNYILKELDSFGTSNGTVNLTGNAPPTYCYLVFKNNLEARGWTVLVDPSDYIPTNCYGGISEPITQNLPVKYP